MVEIKLVCRYNCNFNRVYWELKKITSDFIWKNQWAKVAKMWKK